MTLQDYLTKSGTKRSELARALGVSAVSIHRYLKLGAIPPAPTMLKIFEVTDGQVAPNDFYGVEP